MCLSNPSLLKKKSAGLNLEGFFSKLVAIPKLKSSVCPGEEGMDS